MIYTAGCADKDYADLKPLLEKLDARLVDVRFSPLGKPVQWSKVIFNYCLKEVIGICPHLNCGRQCPADLPFRT